MPDTERPPTSAAPSRPIPRSRRLLAVLALVVALVVFLELASFVALGVLTGGVPSLGEIRRQRAALVPDEPAPPESEEVVGDGAKDLAAGFRAGTHEVIHPFLGFVWDPASDLSQDRFFFKLRVSPQGFLTHSEDAWAAPGTGRPVRVGVFGGSVANILVMAGSQRLIRTLRQDPALADRRIEIVSLALAGYKQPQQLANLTWMLTLGTDLDAVINVDGFNEVALPAAENIPRGVHPLYPRRWDQRTGGLADLGAQLAAGEVEYLRLRRGEVAAAFDRPLLGWSPTWNLLWLRRDRRLAAAETAAVARSQAPHTGQDFLAHGPAFDDPDGDPYPELAAAWARASLQMAQLCAARDVPYHHFLQPNQYVPGSKPLSLEERTLYTRPDHRYRQPVLDGYPELLRAGEDLVRSGVAFHDLTGLFHDVERTVYSDDCCHYNGFGNRILAQAVGDALRDDLVAAVARHDAAAAAAQP
jgi:hypothetical protein